MSSRNDFAFVGQDATTIEPAYMSVPLVVPGKLKMFRIFTYGAMKRGLDIFFAGASLAVLSPLFLVVAGLIKIDSRGPVFFKQVRTGKKGREFEIYKFRSMAADNDMRDLSCDDKYTRMGKFLRRSSIDELPQLINILKGDMAFIGPRPWVPEYFENMNIRERGRYAVRPGITGLAAAKGRNSLSIFEKIGYDIEYVDNYSLKQDVKIVLLTAIQITKRSEANAGKGQVAEDLKALKKENS